MFFYKLIQRFNCEIKRKEPTKTNFQRFRHHQPFGIRSIYQNISAF